MQILLNPVAGMWLYQKHRTLPGDGLECMFRSAPGIAQVVQTIHEAMRS
jgi:hypothetical protein